MTKDPFVVRKCVLLVLRPKLFLPQNQPLHINTRRVLRVPGGDYPGEPDGPVWTRYNLQDDEPYLVESSNPTQKFVEFYYKSMRSQDQGLSIFSLLANANSKLQAAKRRSDYSPPVGTYITSVEDVVEAIFFVPRQLQKKDPLLTPQAAPPPSNQDSAMALLLQGHPPNPAEVGMTSQDKIPVALVVRMAKTTSRSQLTGFPFPKWRPSWSKFRMAQFQVASEQRP